MKTLTTMILTAAATTLCATGLFAQEPVKATIPFDFSAQNTTLPAGDYVFVQGSRTGEYMQVRNIETHQSVMVLAPNGSTEIKGEPRNVVLFHRYGDQYFLSQVWPAGGTIGLQLPKSSSERKVERAMQTGNGQWTASSGPAIVTIAAASLARS